MLCIVEYFPGDGTQPVGASVEWKQGATLKAFLEASVVEVLGLGEDLTAYQIQQNFEGFLSQPLSLESTSLTLSAQELPMLEIRRRASDEDVDLILRGLERSVSVRESRVTFQEQGDTPGSEEFLGGWGQGKNSRFAGLARLERAASVAVSILKSPRRGGNADSLRGRLGSPETPRCASEFQDGSLAEGETFWDTPGAQDWRLSESVPGGDQSSRLKANAMGKKVLCCVEAEALGPVALEGVLTGVWDEFKGAGEEGEAEKRNERRTVLLAVLGDEAAQGHVLAVYETREKQLGVANAIPLCSRVEMRFHGEDEPEGAPQPVSDCILFSDGIFLALRITPQAAALLNKTLCRALVQINGPLGKRLPFAAAAANKARSWELARELLGRQFDEQAARALVLFQHNMRQMRLRMQGDMKQKLLWIARLAFHAKQEGNAHYTQLLQDLQIAPLEQFDPVLWQAQQLALSQPECALEPFDIQRISQALSKKPASATKQTALVRLDALQARFQALKNAARSAQCPESLSGVELAQNQLHAVVLAVSKDGKQVGIDRIFALGRPEDLSGGPYESLLLQMVPMVLRLKVPVRGTPEPIRKLCVELKELQETSPILCVSTRPVRFERGAVVFAALADRTAEGETASGLTPCNLRPSDVEKWCAARLKQTPETEGSFVCRVMAKAARAQKEEKAAGPETVFATVIQPAPAERFGVRILVELETGLPPADTLSDAGQLGKLFPKASKLFMAAERQLLDASYCGPKLVLMKLKPGVDLAREYDFVSLEEASVSFLGRCRDGDGVLAGVLRGAVQAMGKALQLEGSSSQNDEEEEPPDVKDEFSCAFDAQFDAWISCRLADPACQVQTGLEGFRAFLVQRSPFFQLLHRHSYSGHAPTPRELLKHVDELSYRSCAQVFLESAEDFQVFSNVQEETVDAKFRELAVFQAPYFYVQEERISGLDAVVAERIQTVEDTILDLLDVLDTAPQTYIRQKFEQEVQRATEKFKGSIPLLPDSHDGFGEFQKAVNEAAAHYLVLLRMMDSVAKGLDVTQDAEEYHQQLAGKTPTLAASVIQNPTLSERLRAQSK